jgi:hypothetical protein
MKREKERQEAIKKGIERKKFTKEDSDKKIHLQK